MLAPLTALCIATVTTAYGLPNDSLYGLLAVEGGKIGQVVRDTNGTFDIGPFQINSIWARAFAQFWGLPGEQEAITRLRDDGCANAVAAGAILAALYRQSGDIETAYGLYHDHRPSFAASYRAKVIAALNRMRAASPHPSTPQQAGGL